MATYIAGLLSGLHESATTVTVVVKPVDSDFLRAHAPSHRYVHAPRWLTYRPARLVWEQIGLPVLASRLRVDVVHSPHYTFPLISARRTVVTLHDATFFSEPQAHGRGKRLFFRTWIRLARRLSRGTISPSQATASEIRRFVPGPRAMSVAHLGVDRETFHPPDHDELTRFRARHEIADGGRWIAFLGTVEPRKSVSSLVRAHRRLMERSAQTVPPLLVAGGLGWDEDAGALLRAAGDVSGSPLRYLGYLPVDELAAFLGGADVVVYPSTGEGFGLPVLEAMASGVPVLTTMRLAIPEVAGDCVAYTEPDDESIVRDLGAFLADDAGRRHFARAGRERAAAFTWRACAREHETVYAP